MDPNWLPPALVLHLNKVEQKQEEMENGISQMVKLLSRANELAETRKTCMDDLLVHTSEVLEKRNSTLNGINKSLNSMIDASERRNNPTCRDLCCSKGI